MRLLIVVVSGLVLAGCSPAEGPTESPSVSVEPSPTVEQTTLAPSSAPSPTVESVSPSPSPTVFESYPGVLPTDDPESAAIIKGWQEYQRVYEKFVRDPFGFSDVTETQYVTTGHESTVILDRIASHRETKLALLGGRAFRDVQVIGPREDADGVRVAEITYCLDLSNVEVRHTETDEQVDRSGTFVEHAYMREGLDGIWRVEGLNIEDEGC